ncbi:MAG: acetyltransferase [Arcobacteraceae bacterium]|jgi:sugar O-acyltransferase (sialic acid O-acetyltransferase NeuD family)|nr:acetyltransferase [Arcobacteraceae bacterium]
MKRVIVFGTGDISQIAHLYLSEDAGYEVVAFTMDKEYIKEDIFFGLPVVAFENLEEKFSQNEYKLFIPLSYTKINKLREKKFIEAKEKGYSFITYIHPKATVASNAKIGENCFIFEDNTIQPFVTIEDNCILWSGNHIGHHSVIKANCFIASHVVISGGCEIGENTFIGVNATLRDHIKVGKSNVIGAGALILGDTEENKVYMATRTEVSKVPSCRLREL